MLLGVTAQTLRNWDQQGKLNAVRHPINSYRLYLREDLQALLQSLRQQQVSITEHEHD